MRLRTHFQISQLEQVNQALLAEGIKYSQELLTYCFGGDCGHMGSGMREGRGKRMYIEPKIYETIFDFCIQFLPNPKKISWYFASKSSHSTEVIEKSMPGKNR